VRFLQKSVTFARTSCSIFTLTKQLITQQRIIKILHIHLRLLFQNSLSFEKASINYKDCLQDVRHHNEIIIPLAGLIQQVVIGPRVFIMVYSSVDRIIIIIIIEKVIIITLMNRKN